MNSPVLGLVDNCEFGTGEKTTSCMDLQGFWEMIFFQVVVHVHFTIVWNSFFTKVYISRKIIFLS